MSNKESQTSVESNQDQMNPWAISRHTPTFSEDWLDGLVARHFGKKDGIRLAVLEALAAKARQVRLPTPEEIRQAITEHSRDLCQTMSSVERTLDTEKMESYQEGIEWALSYVSSDVTQGEKK